MKRCKVLLLVFICFSFPSCDNNVRKAETFTQDATGYLVNIETVVQNDVKVKAYLKDDLQKGELILHMNIKNNSGDDIVVDYTNCSLSVNAERVVVPETNGSFRIQIPDGEEENYEIYYYPINTLDFYYKTDYRGDMKQRYTLNLDFIRDKHQNKLLNEVLTFQLSDTTYESYLAAYAREEHMEIFGFESDDNFTEKQKQYLKKILPKSGQPNLNQDNPSGDDNDFVFSKDPGITVNKRLVKFDAFRYKDTVTVNIRMLNQDMNKLKILLPACRIEIAGKTFSPVIQRSDSFDDGLFPDSAYILKPGTRLHLLLKYHIPVTTDKWRLHMDWLLVDAAEPHQAENWRKLLYTDLTFKPIEIGKEEN